jgi:type VI secretion system protein ImpC
MEIPQRNTMVTSVNLSVRTREQPQVRPRSPEAPFRILLLGDFSGSAANEDANWKPRRIDIDNWEEVMRRLSPSLQIPVGDPATVIALQSIDDFHPDALFARLPLFQQLRQWRRQLQRDATFPEAARQVRAWAEQEGRQLQQHAAETAACDVPPEKTEPGEPPQVLPSTDQAETGASLLDNLLSRPVSEQARTPRLSLPNRQVAESWEAALRKMVLPYCVDDVSADRDQLVATVDAAAEKLMRMLLHDAGFQNLEGLWRGVEWFLKEEVAEDSPLEISLVDCSWETLQETLAAAEQEEQQEASGGKPVPGDAGRRLASLFFPEPSADPSPPRWQLVLGLFSLGSGEEEAASLERLGRWLSCAQVPLIAQADASHLGYTPEEIPGGVDDWPPLAAEVAERWKAVRANAHMRWIGLIWPRFLLRLPYGRRTQPCESLPLEERNAEWRHTDYLWGNSALLWGAAVARIVVEEDGRPLGSDVIEFGGMPLDIYSEEGEMVAHPCTETLLGERDIAALLARGIMPALAVRGSDAIRLTSFRGLDGEPLVQFTS